MIITKTASIMFTIPKGNKSITVHETVSDLAYTGGLPVLNVTQTITFDLPLPLGATRSFTVNNITTGEVTLQVTLPNKVELVYANAANVTLKIEVPDTVVYAKDTIQLKTGKLITLPDYTGTLAVHKSFFYINYILKLKAINDGDPVYCKITGSTMSAKINQATALDNPIVLQTITGLSNIQSMLSTIFGTASTIVDGCLGVFDAEGSTIPIYTTLLSDWFYYRDGLIEFGSDLNTTPMEYAAKFDFTTGKADLWYDSGLDFNNSYAELKLFITRVGN